MATLTTDSKERKETPVYSGFFKYFPRAIAAIARHSFLANEKHNPGEPVHWSKDKSSDHEDCLLRHLMDKGLLDPEFNDSHTVGVAWRAMAMLEIELEAAAAKVPLVNPSHLVFPEETAKAQAKGPICDPPYHMWGQQPWL